MTENHSIIRLLGVICYITVILYLLNLFWYSPLITITYSMLGAVLLVCSLFFLRSINRYIVVTLILVGIVCFYVEEVSILEAFLGFGENINLLALFLLVPLIGTFMSTAGYLTALKQKVQERERSGGEHPYRLSFFMTSTIGLLLNLGSMALVKRIADESFTSFREQKLTLTIMRGFASCMFWSPYFVNVALVLVLFDLSWLDIGVYGFILTIIYFLVCWLMYNRISFPDDPIVHKNTDTEPSRSITTLKPFYLFIIVLVSLSFLLDYLLHVNMITVVSSLAIILPIFWALGTKNIVFFIQDANKQVLSSFLRLKNELAVFISAGFFGMAISYTNVGDFLSTLLFQASFGFVYILTILLVIIAVLLALIGIHPVIIVIGIGSALSPEKFGVSAEYFALLLLVAWSTATLLSPFSGQVLMAAQLMKKDPILIVKNNYQFVLLLIVILTTTIYSFYLFGFL
ncbi:hypothetical protein ACERII_06855 [Evansella sp. AB-rgal1]|uniref:hypothetical protein n=1 Tax=Evansella sp. AB-rgal1 TaxID=3242696 RepID=UPI00359D9D17